jgi:hypothetical protein
MRHEEWDQSAHQGCALRWENAWAFGPPRATGILPVPPFVFFTKARITRNCLLPDYRIPPLFSTYCLPPIPNSLSWLVEEPKMCNTPWRTIRIYINGRWQPVDRKRVMGIAGDAHLRGGAGGVARRTTRCQPDQPGPSMPRLAFPLPPFPLSTNRQLFRPRKPHNFRENGNSSSPKSRKSPNQTGYNAGKHSPTLKNPPNSPLKKGQKRDLLFFKQ